MRDSDLYLRELEIAAQAGNWGLALTAIANIVATQSHSIALRWVRIAFNVAVMELERARGATYFSQQLAAAGAGVLDPSQDLQVPDDLPVEWRGLDSAAIDLISAQRQRESNDTFRSRLTNCVAGVAMTRAMVAWSMARPDEWGKETDALQRREAGGDAQDLADEYGFRVTSAKWRECLSAALFDVLGSASAVASGS
jgi:hypothetical protein